MQTSRTILSVVLLSVIAATSSAQDTPQREAKAKQFSPMEYDGLPYQQLANNTAGVEKPALVVFLHGGHARGEDNLAQIRLPAVAAFLPFGEASNSARIARFPVTNADYAKFVKKTGHQPPRYWQDGAFPAGKDKHPVLWVSLRDAEAYCAWLGAKDPAHSYRLPTAAEWETAAGPTPRDAEFNSNAVIARRLLAENPGRLIEYVHPKSVRKGEKDKLSDVISLTPGGGVRGWVDHANFTGFIYTDLFKEISDAGGGTTPVDAYPQTKTACGALDMWGNCWEWTSTEVVAENGAERGQKVNAIKGGSWYANRRSCLTDFQGEGRRPDGHYNTVGFRVVQTPKLAAPPAATPAAEPADPAPAAPAEPTSVAAAGSRRCSSAAASCSPSSTSGTGKSPGAIRSSPR